MVTAKEFDDKVGGFLLKALGWTIAIFFILGFTVSFPYIGIPALIIWFARRVYKRRAERLRVRRERKQAAMAEQRRAREHAERMQREAAEAERRQLMAQEDAARKSTAQKRRDDARSAAFLSYTLYAVKLGNRFSR